MSGESNKAILQGMMNALGSGDVGAISDYFSPDLVWHGGSFGTINGRDALLSLIDSFLSAFPDLSVSVEAILADGDDVTVRYTWKGTHREPFQGIPPTGKQVSVFGISIYRIRDGKITEEWWMEDIIGLMQQLGVVPVGG